jgi:photosystem II stability/assembly factor-like uncharacterized protein
MSPLRKTGWILLLCLAAAAPALAGVGLWTPVGGPLPPSARVLVDPVHPETLYALVLIHDPNGDAFALWKSTDAGAHWRSSQEGLGVPIDLLAIDPLQPERLYAWDQTIDVTRPRLWVSEDGGATWSVRFERPSSDIVPEFNQLVPSPLHAGVLYAWGGAVVQGEIRSGIYRSLDAGATWELRGSVGDTFGTLEPLTHHPTRDLLDFIDTQALYESSDGGSTWTVRGTFQGRGFRDLARNAAAPERMYALPYASPTCLVRSDDGGAEWHVPGAPRLPDGVACAQIALDPHNPNLVRIVALGFVREQPVALLSTSRDGGATWTPPRTLPVVSVVPTPADPETLYTGARRGYESPGPLASTDGGRTWTPSYTGITSGDLRSSLVTLPGLDPALLVAVAQVPAVLGKGLTRSLDGGVTWSVPQGDYFGLAADAGGKLLYALRNDGHILRSADGGVSWKEATPKPGAIGPLLADPFRSQRVFTVSPDSDLWRTTDGGRSWARRSDGLPVGCVHYASVDYCAGALALSSDPRRSDRIDRVLLSFAGYSISQGIPILVAPVYLSDDGGGHWRPAAQSPLGGVLALAADPAAPGVFLAGTERGLSRSTDGGEHWAAVVPGLPVRAPVIELLLDDRSRAWYAVTDSKGIFQSRDGGNTWSATGPGLPDLAAPDVVLDPRFTDRLLAAVRGQGVWSWKAKRH